VTNFPNAESGMPTRKYRAALAGDIINSTVSIRSLDCMLSNAIERK